MSVQDRTHRFRAFGLGVTADLALPGVAEAVDRCRSGGAHPPGRPERGRERFSGDPVATWETTLGDGAGLRYDLGPAGDHRVVYGRDGVPYR